MHMLIMNPLALSCSRVLSIKNCCNDMKTSQTNHSVIMSQCISLRQGESRARRENVMSLFNISDWNGSALVLDFVVFVFVIVRAHLNVTRLPLLSL
jgi:hypothetical protein